MKNPLRPSSLRLNYTLLFGLCLPCASPGSGTGLELSSPLDYQVIQRSTMAFGRMLVAGNVSADGPVPDKLEARINAGDWQKLAATFQGRDFTAGMEVPAGGWHRVEVRAFIGGNAPIAAEVPHVGVGEVFVVAGQSNSANHGEEKQNPATGNVATFDGRRWRIANDPQPGASGGGGSFLPPFGDSIAAKFKVPVGFAACGIGATSVREWLPKDAAFPNPPTLTGRVRQLPDGTWTSNGDAFAMLVRRMKQLGPKGFRAVLWHQGESDASQKDPSRTLSGKLYRAHLEAIIRGSRQEIGWDAPWFVAQVSYHVPGDESSPDIRAAQESLWKDGIALQGPDSDAIKGAFRENGGKGVHFSGPGLREHAARWAERVSPWLEALLEPAAPEDSPPQSGSAAFSYQEWKHCGKITILTTPEGANLPAGVRVDGFPLLVRLHKDWFDFSQAGPGGEDVRFSTATGEALPYQIDEWDAAQGAAAIWVRIPSIEGNARQAIHLHWGRAGAADESNGKAVFNESNGYLSVWHLGEKVLDAAGVLESSDTGTTRTAGRIGSARHFANGKGIFCGDKISRLPAGAEPHSTELWFRAKRPNATLIGWGNEEAQGKVVMQYRSPPHIRMDCYFSAGNVTGSNRIAADEWTQMVHTWQAGESKLYVNGRLDQAATRNGPPLNVRRPARMWLGGWYHNHDFAGELDEARISTVARSAEWIRLQFENQKPHQTLVGPVIQPGSDFGAEPAQATVAEGKTVTFTAKTGGAQKYCWVLRRGGREEIVAADRLTFAFEADRVTGDESATLQFRAVYPEGVKTKDMAITITEAIPEPQFTLEAPAAWDGRSVIEVHPKITNLAAMQAGGAGDVTMEWNVSPVAVLKETGSGKLILQRAQNSGRMVVTATLRNGGAPVAQSATINVSEPPRDAWVERTPEKNELPEDGQFFARDDSGSGTLCCNGTLTNAADEVFFRLFADDKPCDAQSAQPGAENSYRFTARLKPGLIRYRMELGTRSGGRETVLHRAGNLVCGDAYVINGQSNAVSTDWGRGEFPETSEWIRTFGSMGGTPIGARWGNAVRKAPGDKLVVGYWGYDFARQLVEAHRIPICIFNGAVGGTRIDQHQRNPGNPADPATIYGRLLLRVREARLTHGIKAVLWHQGENDQGADGPTGRYGWETYRQYFIDLAGGWKRDFPNVRTYCVFQIWPDACSMGGTPAGDMLLEVQRTLPAHFSNLRVLSTIGIVSPSTGRGMCHFDAAGYAQIAALAVPVVEQDHYGLHRSRQLLPPNLVRAGFTSAARSEIRLEFDQSVGWKDGCKAWIELDARPAPITGGRAEGAVLFLTLSGPSDAQSVSYVSGKSWDGKQDRLIYGANGLAALAFSAVPLENRTAARPAEAPPRQ